MMTLPFDSYNVVALKGFLKDRGVTSTGYNRPQLVSLCKCVNDLDLPKNPDLTTDGTTNIQKKILSDFGIEFDPLFATGYSNDLTESPEIGLYDVFNYLITNRPDYDRRKLRAYKSFQDYRLFADGHVENLQYTSIQSIGFFKAIVRPTQRVKSDSYHLWIAVDINLCEIKTAYCQCPGGADGACRHIGAVLYDIEAFEKKGVTDGPAQWTKKACSHDEPVPIKHLKIQKINYGQDIACAENRQESFDPRHENDRVEPTHKQLADFACTLHKINPDSCALELLPTDNLPTDSQKKAVSNDCLSLSFISKISTSPENCESLSQESLDSLKYTDEEIEYIEKETMGQASNPTWGQMRRGIVTSSNCKRVFTRAETYEHNSDTDCSKLASHLLGSTNVDEDRVPLSLAWGRTKEKKAKKMYIQIEKTKHRHLALEEKGLMIDRCCPFLGSSVDGIVSCKCKPPHNKRLIEVKCPWALRDYEPKEASKKRGCYLSNNKWMLKRNSDYYYQIQSQLGICRVQSCDLVIYTKKGVHVVDVPYDKDFFEDMVKRIKQFYLVKLLPIIINCEIKED